MATVDRLYSMVIDHPSSSKLFVRESEGATPDPGLVEEGALQVMVCSYLGRLVLHKLQLGPWPIEQLWP
jgi:hypothetical protein